MNIKQWAVEDRPREKLFMHGAKALTNAELLAILLSTGTKEKSALGLAKDLLSSADNELDRLAMKGLGEMCNVHGVGQAKAITVKAALELANRRKPKRLKRTRLISSADVYEEMKDVFRDLEVEELWAIYLNKACGILGKHKISVGSVGGVIVDAKRIFKPAINLMAYSIVLCHNHPTGRAIPSRADINITERLAKAAFELDIKLNDHLIFGDGVYYSFNDEGKL